MGGSAERGGTTCSVILQRQVLQSFSGPQLQFIDRVDSVRDGVLLVTFLR